jgi:hypothetical protein
MNSDRAHRRLVALTLVVTSSRRQVRQVGGCRRFIFWVMRQQPSLFVISFLVEFVVFLIYFIPACFVFDKNCFLSITVTKAVGERVGERDGEM